MRPITRLGCSLLWLATSGCFSLPTETNAGGHFTVTLSNPQSSNVTVDTYEAKTVAGFYNGHDRRPGTDSGFSTITGTPNPLASINQSECRTLGLGFVGKPEAGKTWELAFIHDAGSTDGGTASGFANGRGSLVYSEGCLAKGEYRGWRSTSGTLRFESVADPAPNMTPPGEPAGKLKTVRFTVSDVQMAPDAPDAGATGTFSLRGEGVIELMTGMDQQP
jgi:hypothetical protein